MNLPISAPMALMFSAQTPANASHDRDYEKSAVAKDTMCSGIERNLDNKFHYTVKTNAHYNTKHHFYTSQNSRNMTIIESDIQSVGLPPDALLDICVRYVRVFRSHMSISG